MHTNPLAKTILCYGDSNTYGQRSDDVTKGRWPAGVRWTSQLQMLLGNNYAVIEEGLSSRTTDLEYAKKPGRNGRQYLLPCIQSHNPLDLVILMLGTNDVKDVFDRSVPQIAEATAKLIADIHKYAHALDKPTKILVVSPILVNDQAVHFKRLYATNYSLASALKSQQLATALAKLAAAKHCAFFDAATVAESGDDGIHFSKPSHGAFARAIAKKLTEAALL